MEYNWHGRCLFFFRYEEPPAVRDERVTLQLGHRSILEFSFLCTE